MSRRFARFFSIFLSVIAFAGVVRRHFRAKNPKAKNNHAIGEGAFEANKLAKAMGNFLAVFSFIVAFSPC
jgi:hypothetical protein